MIGVAGGLDGGVAAQGIETAHDAVDVIFDREFGKAHGRGDFLIGEAAREQRHELLPAASETQTQAEELVQDE